MTQPSADSFFSGGGESFKWPSDTATGSDGKKYFTDTSLMNVWRGGRIISVGTPRQRTDYVTKKPLFWEDGSPKQQLPVTMRADGSRQGILNERNAANPQDMGDRTLYVQGYLQPVIRDAIREAGATGVAVGGELYVCWVGSKDSGKGTPARLWAAKYIPPAVSIPQGGAASQPQAPAAPPNPWGEAPPAQAAPPSAQPPAPPQQPPAQNPWGQQPAAQPQQAPPPQDPWGQAPPPAQQPAAAPPAATNPWA